MEKINLNEELICNYLVTKEMKKVWQKELEILEQIINICNKYNIRYSISGGTMLGAIRHKGFIPWDNDIDLWMPAEDYNIFLEIAQQELKEPYFVQYYKTEKLYNRGHAQIRNSNTTAIINNEDNKFNKGIFVDIFPLHNLPDNKFIRKKYIKKIERKRRLMRLKINESDKGIKKYIKKFIISKINMQKKINKFEKYISKYDKINTKECGSIGFIPNERFKKEWFNKYINVDFEYLKVKCIADYDEYLIAKYGDYMKIPKDKNGTMHGGIFFDTEKSYKYYDSIKEGE